MNRALSQKGACWDNAVVERFFNASIDKNNAIKLITDTILNTKNISFFDFKDSTGVGKALLHASNKDTTGEIEYFLKRNIERPNSKLN